LVIILIRRSVRADKEMQFLASYERERPNHVDFISEQLTKVSGDGDLPVPLRSFPLASDCGITYINVAVWRSAKSFEDHFNPKSGHDPEIECADRVRVVLDVVRETGLEPVHPKGVHF
jgi:hypothetical protein